MMCIRLRSLSELFLIMRLKLWLFLILASALLVFSSSYLISHSNTVLPKKEEKPILRFQFWVTFGSVDWQTRSVSTDIWIRIESLPYNHSSIEARIENVFYGYDQEKKKTYQVDGGHATLYLFQTEHGEEGFNYEGNVSIAFRRFGLTEFYPYDIYMVNITFSLPNFGLINENSVELSVYFLGEIEKAGGQFSSVVWDGEQAKLNYRYFFSRGPSEVHLFLSVIQACYLLLGSTPLINPERLEHRLTICLTLFIFSITFFTTISPPTRTTETWRRMTLSEAMVYALVTGTGYIAVVSVLEKVLIEAKPRLRVCQYAFEGIFLLVTIGTLLGYLGWFSSALMAYPWQANPAVTGLISGLNSIPWLSYGYVSKTLVFAVRSLRNRAQISKEVKAIRLFHRKAKGG